MNICQDCIHFREIPYEQDICGRLGSYIEPVYGHKIVSGHTCNFERSEEGECGPAGIHFQQRAISLLEKVERVILRIIF